MAKLGKKEKKPSLTDDEIRKISQLQKEVKEGDGKNAYVDPGPKPSGLFKVLKWRRKVKKERRKLRRRLKKQGIKDRETFEKVAWQLGLILDNGRFIAFLDWWKWFLAWLGSAAGLRALIGLITTLLFLAFLISYVITERNGAFTINLSGSMTKLGFVLSETKDFEETAPRLYSEKVENINNITLDDIVKDVDDIDGSHNGVNYLAYTFYIKNTGEEAGSYTYTFNLNDSSRNVEDAVWIMLFEDGHQVIYAKSSADGDEERLVGYDVAPFEDVAYDPDEYYVEDGSYGIRTTAYIDDYTVMEGIVEHVQPGEYHKYTVVIWLEGNDPECTDEIMGGFAKYSMTFDVVSDEDESIFSGVYRTEYEDYANGKITAEDSDSTSGISTSSD